MTHNEETRRTGKCGRASEMSLGRDDFEVPETAPSLQLQTAWLSARFAIGAAYARVIAEHAFQNGGAA